MYRLSLVCFALLLSFGGVAAQQLQGGFRLKVRRQGFQAHDSTQRKEEAPLLSSSDNAEQVVLYRLGGKHSDKQSPSFAAFTVQASEPASPSSRKSVVQILESAGKSNPSLWAACVVSPRIGIYLHTEKGREHRFLVDPDCPMIYVWSSGKYLRYSSHPPSVQQIVDLYEAILQAPEKKQGSSKQKPASNNPEYWHPSLLPNKKNP